MGSVVASYLTNSTRSILVELQVDEQGCLSGSELFKWHNLGYSLISSEDSDKLKKNLVELCRRRVPTGGYELIYGKEGTSLDINIAGETSESAKETSGTAEPLEAKEATKVPRESYRSESKPLEKQVEILVLKRIVHKKNLLGYLVNIRGELQGYRNLDDRHMSTLKYEVYLSKTSLYELCGFYGDRVKLLNIVGNPLWINVELPEDLYNMVDRDIFYPSDALKAVLLEEVRGSRTDYFLKYVPSDKTVRMIFEKYNKS